MTWMIPLSSFVLGTAIGSFCNVVIYRLHAGDSPVRGRSYCPHCKQALAARDLVPIASFIMLRGRCRSCGGRISLQYPLVEAATGVSLAVIAWRFGPSALTPVVMLLAAFLIVIFVYDLRYQLILDRVSVPGMAVAFLVGLMFHRSIPMLLLGGVVGAGFFALQYALSRGRWIGGGDIRLGAVLGLALGWPLTVVALVLSYLAGSIVAISLIAAKRRSWTSMIPFGTFLSATGMVAMLWGQDILAWYLHGGFFTWFVSTFLRY